MSYKNIVISAKDIEKNAGAIELFFGKVYAKFSYDNFVIEEESSNYFVFFDTKTDSAEECILVLKAILKEGEDSNIYFITNYQKSFDNGGNFIKKTLNYPLEVGQLLELKKLMFAEDNSDADNLDVDLIGVSEETKKLKTLIKKIAPSKSNVLIRGESGVGKEVVANSLHKNSIRKNLPFVAVNCAAIPDNLLESELFGYEKGAFTGALSSKKGKFEMANGGTLFLDEIGEMPMNMQAKLLRVIQERKVERVGGLKEIAIDVRIVSATNANLEEKIKEGKFREDLYYRINVVPLEIKPLRERPQDIMPILMFLIDKMSSGYANIEFKEKAIEVMEKYSWPGNVRELSNVAERILYLVDTNLIGEKEIIYAINPISDSNDGEDNFNEIHHMLENIKEDTSGSFKDRVVGFEKTLISQALQKSNGNIAKASSLLNIKRTTLIEKMKRYGIEKVAEY